MTLTRLQRLEAPKALLRLVTCGGVDDGRRTLLGRLLVDTQVLFADQLSALAVDSNKPGTRDDADHDAPPLDGLQAECAEGITNDVTYRCFETARRKFIVADAPGDEQSTRNLVTGARTADLAVLVVDASKGLHPQTRRHTVVLSRLGIRNVILCVNKMDRVGFSQAVFEGIASEYRKFADLLSFENVSIIPVAAISGENVVHHSGAMPWSSVPPLLELLESAPLEEDRAMALPFRMPVQLVLHPNAPFRGLAGTLAGGTVRPGQAICILPGGRATRVERIVGAAGDLDFAAAPQAVTLTLADDVEVVRGDMLSSIEQAAQVADQFEASLVWLDVAPLLRGRNYLMKIASRTVTATVSPLKYRLNVDTLERLAANTLEMNQIGVAALELDQPVAFDPHAQNPDTGGFVLIDRLTNRTVAAGMLHFALRRSHNLHWQTHDVDAHARAALKGQRPCVVWFTGLSAAGKTTIANLVEKRLHALGHHTYLLDGDNVRHGLNKDLGFTPADRVENIRRVTEVAALMADAGLIVLTAFISPFRSERASARARLQGTGFIEVFVDAPLALAEQRDPKGLYKKARLGELANFTGIDSPYETPDAAELRLDTAGTDAQACAEAVIALLRERAILPSGA